MDYKEHLEKARKKKDHANSLNYTIESACIEKLHSHRESEAYYEEAVKQLESDLQMAKDAIFNFKKIQGNVIDVWRETPVEQTTDDLCAECLEKLKEKLTLEGSNGNKTL